MLEHEVQESIVFNGKEQLITQKIDYEFSGKIGCVVDWVSFSIDVSKLRFSEFSESFIDFCFKSLGFPSDIKFSYVRRHTGIDFYHETFLLIYEGNNFGHVSVKLSDYFMVDTRGEMQTVRFVFNGAACTFFRAKFDFTAFLQEAMYSFPETRLHRIDIAYDDVENSFDFLYASRSFFKLDSIREIRDEKNGTTIYVGSSTSTKQMRVYQKGKQLKLDSCPDWVRVEIQYTASGIRHIPLDIFSHLDSYFFGAYQKFFSLVFGTKYPSLSIPLIPQSSEVSLERAIENIRRQYGAYIFALSTMYSPDELVSLLSRKDATTSNGFPSKLVI